MLSRTLAMRDQAPSGAGAEQLARGLSGNRALKTLILSYNKALRPHAPALRAAQVACCVRHGTCFGVQIGDGAYALACGAERNKSLERLALQYNDVPPRPPPPHAQSYTTAPLRYPPFTWCVQISDAIALSCHAPLSNNRTLASFDLS